MAVKLGSSGADSVRRAQLERAQQTEASPKARDQSTVEVSEQKVGCGELDQEVVRNLGQGKAPTGGSLLQLLQQNGSPGMADLRASADALIERFSQISEGDKFIRKEHLERLRDGEQEGATPELRALAARLLDSPAVLHTLDTGAGKGGVDGKISLNDLQELAAKLGETDWSAPTPGVEGAVDSIQEARAVLDRHALLADTAAGRGGRDGHISEKDLKALAQDSGVPAQLRQAARFLLDRDPRVCGLDELADLAAAAAADPDRAWSPGRPLAEAKNAHSTNTKGDMRHALEGGYSYLECDIRTEINSPHRLETRHDKGHESGDNLCLDEWLKVGAQSGLGLKLDVKEGERMPEILDAVERAGVPQHRLMLNINDADAARWGAEIRRRFPDATLAINPTDRLGDKENGGELQDWQVQRMLDHARAAGGPINFVMRYDRLTDEAIAALKPYGNISVWNSPSQGGVDDVEALTQELRERGVDGVIDLRPSMGLLDKAGAVADRGKNAVKDIWDKIF